MRAAAPAGAGALTALLALVQPAAARGDGPSALELGADALVAEARALGLDEEPQWLRLVHYRRTLLGGWESEAEGPGFFLSPDGRTDPGAELEATLRGFLEPVAAPGDPEASGDASGARPEHPQCAFPARLAWLSGRLALDPARLPRPACPPLDAYRKQVQARGATLVFSAWYLQSAASAFGHTFLRLDREPAGTEPGSGLGGTGRELLDQGVNFAAEVDTGNALAYAWKGLTGGFRGAFAYQPYYYKVREYGDFESRDLWEYELDLSPDETQRLADHVWELGHTWFDYTYARGNCSYHVLGALDAASPRLDLVSRTKPVVLPADTVRLVWSTPGLVRAVRYRPSIRSQFRARAAALSPAEADALAALVESPAAPLPDSLPPGSRARALDAAMDWVDWVHAKAIVGNVPTPAADARQSLLVRRAALGIPSPELRVDPEARDAPHLGHDSVRIGLGAGPSSSTWPVVALDVRLAGHDLADPPSGHPRLDELVLGAAELQWEPRNRNTFYLERFTVVGLRSLADFGRFERRASWELSVGAERLHDAGCDGCLAGQGAGGAGVATTIDAGERVAVFGLAQLAIQGTPDLRGIAGGPVRLGLGPGAGVRAALGDRLVLLATGSWWWFPGATVAEAWQLRAVARWGVGRAALDVDLRAWPLERQALVRVLLYF